VNRLRCEGLHSNPDLSTQIERLKTIVRDGVASTVLGRRRHGRNFVGIRPDGDSGIHLPKQGHRDGEEVMANKSRGSRATARKPRRHGSRLGGSRSPAFLCRSKARNRGRKRRCGRYLRLPCRLPKLGRWLDATVKRGSGEASSG
jgi:hypothetical protein